jgi:hypothetical protein
VLLLAALTLPPRWEGLQPIDGAILGRRLAAYFGRAVLQPRRRRATPAASRAASAAAGAPAIAVGALLSVTGAQRLGGASGVPGPGQRPLLHRPALRPAGIAGRLEAGRQGETTFASPAPWATACLAHPGADPLAIVSAGVGRPARSIS